MLLLTTVSREAQEVSKLFFGDIFSILTTIAVVGLLSFATARITRAFTKLSWGKALALFIALGLGVSFMSAMRDGYASEEAIFSMTSMQSNVCSITGGLVMLAGLLSLIIKNEAFRKAAFLATTALFVVQVLVIEISRMAILL